MQFNSTQTQDIIYINDKPLPFNVNDGFNIYQVCLLNNLQLPRFCYHNKLHISGNCRICLVELEKTIKPIISCSVIAELKMVIFTDTKIIKYSQEAMFEYLLINHPLDCPICDQGGECDLQDQTFLFGADRGRFYESFKRSVENGNYGPLIKVVLNRCIQCARCTRFLWDIAGSNSLIFVNRGLNMQISSYITKFINNELSGNIIDLCPVGALTSKPYAHVSRLWEILDLYYVDIMDNNHSNINIQCRGLTILRIIPRINEYLNEDWITDKIRFFYDGLVNQRLLKPYFLFNLKKLLLSWLNAFYLIKFYFVNFFQFYLLKKIQFTLLSTFIGDWLNLEEILNLRVFILKFSFSFFKSIYVFKETARDFRFSYLLLEKFNRLNNIPFYILLYINPRFESPLLNLKLKKIIEPFILLIGFLSNFTYIYKHLGTNILQFLKFFEITQILSKFFSYKYNYFWIFGASFFSYFSYLLINFKKVYGSGITMHNIYSIIHNNNSDILIQELNLTNNFSYIYFRFISWFYNFIYMINTDNFKLNFKKTKYLLYLYQGSHGDCAVKYATLIFPTKLFLEKPSIFINNEGLLQNLQHFFFKYNFKTTKNDSNIFYMLMDLFKIKNYDCNGFDNNNLQKNINSITPIFLVIQTSYYLSNWICSVGNAYILNFKFFSLTLSSLINNFYLTNSITRNSKVLSLCSKFFTISNDFKYLCLINI